MLIGDLSAHEMLFNACRMKTELSINVIDRKVEALLEQFGLGHIIHNPIGTNEKEWYEPK